MHDKVTMRLYTTVTEFSHDLLAVLNEVLDPTNVGDAGESSAAPGEASEPTPSLDIKAQKALAKRIIKAVQPALEDALSKECDLRRNPDDEQVKRFDSTLTNGNTPKTQSNGLFAIEGTDDHEEESGIRFGADDKHTEDVGLHNGDIDPAIAQLSNKRNKSGRGAATQNRHHRMTPDSAPLTNGFHSPGRDTNQEVPLIPGTGQPPTPPMSAGDEGDASLAGGIPWYMSGFNPQGTTIFEEEEPAVDGNTSASDELSDLDEEALSGLVGKGDFVSKASPPKKVLRSQSRSVTRNQKKAKAPAPRRKRAR